MEDLAMALGPFFFLRGDSDINREEILTSEKFLDV